tara:strand:+ start:364 stop:639 length:276 start_codon:yes stop_codon:yes gene_type:complete
MIFFEVNRYVCTVLEEMRTCVKNLSVWTIYKNRRHLTVLIEEAQTLVNRMESAIEDSKSYEDMMIERRELKKEIKQLNIDKKIVGEKIDEI